MGVKLEQYARRCRDAFSLCDGIGERRRRAKLVGRFRGSVLEVVL
jgi:hypothetical protein